MSFNPLLRPALMPSDNQKAAMDAASSPSGSNPFATLGDGMPPLTSPTTSPAAVGMKTSAFNAGTTISVGQLVYLNSSSQWVLTDADAAATAIGMLGIALAAGTAGNPVSVALAGSLVRYDSWTWTTGSLIYIDTATSGAMVHTYTTGTDDVIRSVGWAVSATVVYFFPAACYITHV